MSRTPSRKIPLPWAANLLKGREVLVSDVPDLMGPSHGSAGDQEVGGRDAPSASRQRTAECPCLLARGPPQLHSLEAPQPFDGAGIRRACGAEADQQLNQYRRRGHNDPFSKRSRDCLLDPLPALRPEELKPRGRVNQRRHR